MLKRSATLLLLLLALGWIVGAEESSPRQVPPSGRALPPAPALDEEGTVKAAMPVRHGSLKDELAAQRGEALPEAATSKAATTAERPAFRLRRTTNAGQPRQLGRRVLNPAELAAAADQTKQVAPTEELPTAPVMDSVPTPKPARTPLRGKHATEPGQWRKFEPAVKPELPTPTADLKAADDAPAAALPDYQSAERKLQPAKRELVRQRLTTPLQLAQPLATLFELNHSFMLAPATLVASTQGAAFSTQSGLRSAPVELVLPQPPPRLPEPSVRASLTEISRGNTRQKRVALTFDDGPHPEYTSQLLAILDHYDARATFFVVGIQCQKYPHWVKMINQAGHELANHTYDHFRLPQLPQEEQLYQIDECTRLIEQLTGTTPRFFRPPGGRYDANIAGLLRQRGMVLALWDAALNDTAEDREAADLLKSANKQIRPGSVVLIHDGVQATVDMLPQLIEALRKDGYEFVTLSELASGL